MHQIDTLKGSLNMYSSQTHIVIPDTEKAWFLRSVATIRTTRLLVKFRVNAYNNISIGGIFQIKHEVDLLISSDAYIMINMLKCFMGQYCLFLPINE